MNPYDPFPPYAPIPGPQPIPQPQPQPRPQAQPQIFMLTGRELLEVIRALKGGDGGGGRDGWPQQSADLERTEVGERFIRTATNNLGNLKVIDDSPKPAVEMASVLVRRDTAWTVSMEMTGMTGLSMKGSSDALVPWVKIKWANANGEFEHNVIPTGHADIPIVASKVTVVGYVGDNVGNPVNNGSGTNKGTLIVSVAEGITGYAQRNTTYLPVNIPSVVNSNKQMVTGPGRLAFVRAFGLSDNTTFLMGFDSTTLPPDTSTPLVTITSPTTVPGIDFDLIGGVAFCNGWIWVVSSTSGTLTKTSAAWRVESAFYNI